MSVKQCKEAIGSNLYQTLRKEKNLPLKYIMFIAKYISNGNNATEAYLDSIARKGTKKASACTEACNTLIKPNIQEAIKIVFDDWLGGEKLRYEKEIIQRQYTKAFYNVKTFFNDDGTCKKLSEVPDEWVGAIEGHEVKYYGKDGNRKVIVFKLADQQKALQELSKYITLYKGESDDGINISKETVGLLMGIFRKGEKK